MWKYIWMSVTLVWLLLSRGQPKHCMMTLSNLTYWCFRRWNREQPFDDDSEHFAGSPKNTFQHSTGDDQRPSRGVIIFQPISYLANKVWLKSILLKYNCKQVFENTYCWGSTNLKWSLASRRPESRLPASMSLCSLPGVSQFPHLFILRLAILFSVLLRVASLLISISALLSCNLLFLFVSQLTSHFNGGNDFCIS